MPTPSNKRYRITFAGGLASFLLTIVAACVLFTPKASANIFPSDWTTPNGAPDDHLAVSSWQGDWHPATNSNGSYINGTGKYNCQYPSLFPGGQEPGACDTGLNGQSTFYELYTPNFGGAVPSTTITIDTGCLVNADTPYNKPDHPDKGNRQITVNIYQITSSGGRGALMSSSDNFTGGSPTHCDGNGNLIVNVPGSAFTTNESSRYAGDTLTALIGIYKDADVGNKTFRIETGGAVSVYGAPGDYFAEVDKYPPGYSAEVAPGDYESKDPTIYSFNFIPDCTFPGGKVTIGLDALSFGSPVQTDQIKLYLLSPGNVQSTELPFNNTVGWTTPTALQEGQSYKLYILNVNVDNGVKFKLPYGEYPAPPSQHCQPIQHVVTGQCNTLTVHDTSYYDSPTYGQVRSRTHVTITSPPGPTIVNNETIGYHATHPPNSYTWDYSPGGPKVSINIYREMAVNNHWLPEDGNGGADSTQGTGTYTCYEATCSLTVVGDGPQGIVEAGGTAHVTGSINNFPTGNPNQQDIPASLPSGPYLSVSESPGGVGHAVGQMVPLGESRSVSYDVLANGSAGSQTINAYPDFWGYGNFGPFGGYTCSATFPVYGEAKLKPHATLTYPTKENPTYVKYGTYVENDYSVAVPAPTQSSFTVTPYGGGFRCAGVGPVNSSGPFDPGSPPPNYTISGTCNPASIVAGDQYCAEIHFTAYNDVWISPGAPPVPNGFSGPASDQQCLTVVNEPYFKVYNGSVSAAAVPTDNNAGTCTTGGVLAGWHNNASGNYGAGSQLSALALIQVTGFASAINTVNVAGSSLTFANAGVGWGGQPVQTSPTDLESPHLGGLFDDPANNHCVAGLARGNPMQHLGNSGTVGSALLNNGDHSFGDASPVNFTLNGGQVATGNNLTIYVTGNVYIGSNIKVDTSGWNINGINSNVPSFNLVVTAGNIYIDPSVTELDGVYEARPDSSGHKGTIYTCADPATHFAPMATGQLYGGCHNQLTVYGSFRGQEVKLMRTFGSLRDDPNSAAIYPPNKCSNPNAAGIPLENDSITALYPACAGEVFRFSPEIYLSTPALPPPNHGAPTWDAAASLPPVL